MSVLVTGAAGFLGRHLVTRLLDEGHEVVGVDNFVTSDRHEMARLTEQAAFEFHEVDVTSPGFRAIATEAHPSEIFHLACPTGVPNLRPLALEMLETSFDGTRHVLEAAYDVGARVLVASSAEVYGNPTVSPQTEDYTGNVDTLGPRNGYEEGKRVAETLCAIYADRFGTGCSIARIFNTYGPGMSLNDTRVVPAFVRAALAGVPLLIHGDGSQKRCHSYVDDTVRGLLTVARHGESGAAYNIGSEHAMTVQALAERIIAVSDSRSTIEHIGRPGHDHDARLPATERARELGWAASTPLEVGLQATIADFAARLGVRTADLV